MDDRAQLLGDHEKERINRACRKLLEDVHIHIMTVVLDKPPADIDMDAVDIFTEYRIGEKTGAARGVLFLVDPVGSRVRLEIGYDLEGVFTDAFTGYIERSQMAPFFQSGRVGHGIEATMELLVSRAMEEDDFSETAFGKTVPSALEHLSGGAGARTEVEIGSGLPAKEASSAASLFTAQSTPQQTMALYMQVLRLHIKDPELAIYTDETREFFRKWLVTDAQQNNELKTLKRILSSEETLVNENLAVVRFPVSDRHASPYFLRDDGLGWMLDFASMSRVIGFNHKNQWFFRSTDHPFMFAFQDVVFDRHGFPHRQD